MSNEPQLAFWNSRAQLGYCAGTNDFILKEMEVNTIAGYIRDGMRILDFGCGNCVTAIALAKTYKVHIHCVDFSQGMIAEGTRAAYDEGVIDYLSFEIGDTSILKNFNNEFDCVYTERVIINLKTWEEQARAIADIIKTLRNGGQYIMCENSMDGLDEINKLRATVQLEPISPPWHNLYLCDEKVAALEIEGVSLVSVNHFSATYYLFSRVMNAALARDNGTEPNYDSPINKLAARLPSIGTSAQVKIWLWQKH